jgi:hypothetical protein
MKTIFLLAVFVLTFFQLQSFAQQKTYDNWEELKRVQAEERLQMQNSQKEELSKINELQKVQIDAILKTTPPSDHVINLSKEQMKERTDVIRIHTEERAKLTAIHEQERTAFRQNELKSKP